MSQYGFGEYRQEVRGSEQYKHISSDSSRGSGQLDSCYDSGSKVKTESNNPPNWAGSAWDTIRKVGVGFGMAIGITAAIVLFPLTAAGMGLVISTVIDEKGFNAVQNKIAEADKTDLAENPIGTMVRAMIDVAPGRVIGGSMLAAPLIGAALLAWAEWGDDMNQMMKSAVKNPHDRY